MAYEFEVIDVIWHHNRGDFIFARHLGNNHDFAVTEGAIFGDIPIYHYMETQTMKGWKSEDPSVFVFKPVSMERLPENYFSNGQKVTLNIKASD